MSKQYARTNEIEYWFGLSSTQKEFLASSKTSYLACGCGLPEKLLVIPFDVFEPYLYNMNTTQTDKILRWHIKIFERVGHFYLMQPLIDDRLEITQYLITNDPPVFVNKS